MDFGDFLTPKAKKESENLQETLENLKQSLEDAKNNEKMLNDELNSTKTKLKNAESQLLHSPRWSQSQKKDSDIKFLTARHQTELDELKGQISQKDIEISSLQQQLMTNSPEANYLLSFLLKTNKRIIEEKFFKNDPSFNNQLNLITKNIEEFNKEPKKIKEMFKTIKTFIEILIKENSELINALCDTTEKDMIIQKVSTAEEQIKRIIIDFNKIKEEKKKLEIENENLQEKINNLEETNTEIKEELEENDETLSELTKKLGSDENSNNLKRIEELLKNEKENEEMKVIVKNFAEKSLGFQTISNLSNKISKQVFDSVLSKINNNDLMMKELSNVFGIAMSSNLLSDIEDKYSELVQNNEIIEKDNKEKQKIIMKMNEEISKLQNQISSSKHQNNSLKASLTKEKKLQDDIEEEKAIILSDNNKLLDSTKKMQKKIDELSTKLTNANKSMQKQNGDNQKLGEKCETMKNDLECLEKALNEAKENYRKASKENQKLQNENQSISNDLSQNKSSIEKLNEEVADLSQYRAKHYAGQEEILKQNERIRKITEKLNFLKSENEKSRQLLDAFSQKITKYKNQISALKAENKDLKSNLQKQTTETKNQTSNYENAIKKLNETSQELSKTKENVEKRTSDISEKEQHIANLQKMIELLKLQLSNAGNEITKLEDSIKSHKKENADLQQKDVQISIEMEKIKGSLEVLQSENKTLNERLKNQNNEMIALHESDVNGKIAKEDLRKAKEQIEKLKNELKESCSKNEELKNELCSSLEENEEIKKKNANFDEENKEIKEAIYQRDAFISNVKNQRREAKVLRKALNETETRLNDTEKAFQSLKKENTELNEQYNNDVSNMQRQIVSLTEENEKKSQKNEELNLKLSNAKESLKSLSKAASEHKLLISQLTERLNTLKMSTVKKSLFEQIHGKLKNAEQEILELRSETSEKDAKIAISANKTRDYKDIKENYNKDHTLILQIKSNIQSLNYLLKSSKTASFDDILEYLQPLFDAFSLAFEPGLFKKTLSFNTSKPISVQSCGEVFTSKHRAVLLQIINKLKQFPVSFELSKREIPLLDRLREILSFFDEVQILFNDLENNNKRLQNIVQSQHIAICSMTNVPKIQKTSPKKKRIKN